MARFRFIHSADWQLGARFSQFGARGNALRAARLATLEHTLELARRKEVDAFIVAGDLFEDNQVDDGLVSSVVETFARFPSFRIILLPGNHDPFTGPDCVWQRRAFLKLPSNIQVVAKAGIIDFGSDVFIVASPLHQKLSTTDPSLKLAELTAGLPTKSIKIGVTHGALAIEGKHSPTDFPIALNAATRAGLDYLALGHWHNWLSETDSGRSVMPGTPEPDQFANERSGHIASVEIHSAGSAPIVEPIRVATLTWKSFVFDFGAPDSSRATIDQALASLIPDAAHTVVRVTMAGTASPGLLAQTRVWLESALTPFLVGQVVDRTQIALSAAEITDVQNRHPILAQVLMDIDRLETLALGTTRSVPPAMILESPNAPSVSLASETPLTLSEVQALLAPSRIDLARLSAEHFAQLRQLVLQTLQEVST